MNLRGSLSKQYGPALQVAIVFQAIFGILQGLMLDYGQMFQLWLFTMLAWWGGFGVMVFRRPQNPTKADLFLIRWSFPFMAVLIVPFLSILIWKARGVWN